MVWFLVRSVISFFFPFFTKIKTLKQQYSRNRNEKKKKKQQQQQQ